MIKRRDLSRALRGKKPITDWVIFESTQDIAIADARREKLARRREQRQRLRVVIHVDDPRGRGSALVEIASQETDAGAIVDHAIELATAATGRGWKSVPAAAPAKVDLLDPAMARRNVSDIAVGIVGTLRAPEPATVSACARVTYEQIVVETRAGLTAKWETSTYEIDGLVSDGKNSIAIRRSARREADLALADVITSAANDLVLLGTAAPVKSGACTLVLEENAFLHDDDMGVWSVFAAQADAVLERQGLTRYRVGVAVAPGADAVQEPLSITSNGALDFAMRSAPLGEDGDAIRMFTLVERGIAKALGLSPREAAMRGKDPNGGVRNLVVGKGTWDGAIVNDATSVRTIQARRLRALTIDLYTGEASLELALAVEHAGGKLQAFTGGTIRLDLIAALARARRTAATIRRGAYQGPSSLLVTDAVLI